MTLCSLSKLVRTSAPRLRALAPRPGLLRLNSTSTASTASTTTATAGSGAPRRDPLADLPPIWANPTEEELTYVRFATAVALASAGGLGFVIYWYIKRVSWLRDPGALPSEHRKALEPVNHSVNIARAGKESVESCAVGQPARGKRAGREVDDDDDEDATTRRTPRPPRPAQRT